MKNKYKVIVLSLVFVLPVATFLFLKFFGENKFEIPVLKDANIVMSCDSSMSVVLTESIDIVFLKNKKCEKEQCSMELDQLKRVAQRFSKETKLRYSILSKDEIIVNWKFKNLSAYTFKTPVSLSCLGLESHKNYFLLFDTFKQLRGIYEIERNEVDRLIIELDILNRYK